MNPSHELLRRLAANDEASLRLVLRPTPEFGQGVSAPEDAGQPTMPQLDRRTRVLVRLAALLAIGAPTASLRWAVELASATGAGDDALAAVLVSTAAETGGAQISWSASRLALALGFDLEIDGWDGA
jgi:alkylhydroperoxidase/carboxymuconolactone decarboxylase family protein YurZ